MATTHRKNRLLITAGKENCSRNDMKDVIRCVESVKESAIKLGWSVERAFIKPEDFEGDRRSLFEKITEPRPDCIFNLFEGFSFDTYKEIEFAEAMESRHIPFTGNSSNTLKICLDKYGIKSVLSRNKIPVPNGQVVREEHDIEKLELDPPLFVKPCCEDASVGIDDKSLILDKNNIRTMILNKFKEYPKGLLVEEFIPGKEYNAGFLGSSLLDNVGVSEMDYSKFEGYTPFMSFGSKWDKLSKEYDKLMPTVLTKMDEYFRNDILGLCTKVANITGCKSYFRIDLREKDGKLFVLDVNPNPDINSDSGFIRQAFAKGLTYEDVVQRIIANAFSPDNKGVK